MATITPAAPIPPLSPIHQVYYEYESQRYLTVHQIQTSQCIYSLPSI